MWDLRGQFLDEGEAVAQQADVLDCDVVALDLLHFQRLFLQDHFFGGAVVMVDQFIHFGVQVGDDELDVLAFSDCLFIILSSDAFEQPAHADPFVDEFAEEQKADGEFVALAFEEDVVFEDFVLELGEGWLLGVVVERGGHLGGG